MTAISDRYTTLGGAAGFLGAAVTGESPAANGGFQQDFQHGTICWHRYTGAWEVQGLIRDRWLQLGGTGSPLGYPPTNESTTPDGIGRYNHFQHGSVYWTPTTGAQEVLGAIRARWAELRWERGLLGYPIAAPYEETRNRQRTQIGQFSGGKVEVNLSTQRVLVEKFATPTSPNYLLPLVTFRVSDDDGSRACAITTDGVQQWVDEANRFYAAAGIRFAYDGVLRDLRDTEVNGVTGDDYPTWPSVVTKLNQLAATHRSIVVVHGAEIGGGFSWWTYDFVAMSFFDAANLNSLSLLAHELGHHLGLPHTLARTFQYVRETEDFLLSGGSLSNLDGDAPLIHDTPPDPDIVELRDALSVDAVTLAGQAVTLARRNIMSYHNHGGRGQLTHDQIDRVRQIVIERRGRYLNVSVITPVDCAGLLAQRAQAVTRLAQVTRQRDAETDSFRRHQYYGTMARLQNSIQTLTARLLQAGCI